MAFIPIAIPIHRDRNPFRLCTAHSGRPIKLADGTTVSMPDTPANQKVYPQISGQKPGVGFPIMRLVGLISLSCAAVLDVAMGPYQGKRTGENALLQQIVEALRAGDVLLADACYANYWTVAQLRQHAVDIVTHHDGKRRIDFRKGQRLGHKDHIILWHKPARPAWMTAEMYARQPETLYIREVMVQVHQRGFRTRSLVVITTLLDAGLYSSSDLAAAYHARWNIELDMRSIKPVMEMDVLRCKTPQMVRKEIWMHLLAYNLVRPPKPIWIRGKSASRARCKHSPPSPPSDGRTSILIRSVCTPQFCTLWRPIVWAPDRIELIPEPSRDAPRNRTTSMNLVLWLEDV